MSRHRGRSGRSSPRGFSIVEVLVAMMLVAVGLLSIVGAGSVLVRRRNEARQRLAMVALASNRVAKLSGAPCRSTSGTTSAGPTIVERWWVSPLANATREIVDS